MFKSIGKAFTKMFNRNPKAGKVTMEQAKAIASKEQDKKAEKVAVPQRSKVKRTLISKKSQYIAEGRRSNLISEDVRKLEPAKRAIKPFGNFRPIKNAWYLPLKSHRKKV